jgi:probable addiction module antidote protein
MKKRSGEIDYYEVLLKDLQDPKEAKAYLNVALQDEDPRMFLIALRNVLQATGKGMTDLAKETDLNRESLYRSLSNRGNPKIKSVVSILRTLDLQLGVHSMRK